MECIFESSKPLSWDLVLNGLVRFSKKSHACTSLTKMNSSVIKQKYIEANELVRCTYSVKNRNSTDQIVIVRKHH